MALRPENREWGQPVGSAQFVQTGRLAHDRATAGVAQPGSQFGQHCNAGTVQTLYTCQVQRARAIQLCDRLRPDRSDRRTVEHAGDDQRIARALHGISCHWPVPHRPAGCRCAARQPPWRCPFAQRAVELGLEGLHVGNAFDHHVEDLPLAAGVAHQVIDRGRVVAGAQQVGGDLDAAVARQRAFGLGAEGWLAFEVEQRGAVTLHQVVGQCIGKQLDVGIGGAAAVHAQHQTGRVVAVEGLVQFAIDELTQCRRIATELGTALVQRAQDAGAAVDDGLGRRALCRRAGRRRLRQHGGRCAHQQGRGQDSGKQGRFH